MKIASITAKRADELIAMLRLGGVSQSDKAAVQEILGSGVKMTDAVRKKLERFVGKDTRPVEPTLDPKVRKAIWAEFSSLMQRAILQWRPNIELPLGPKIFRVQISPPNVGTTYTALFAGDPSRTGQYWVESAGGRPIVKQYVGPFPMPGKGDDAWPPPVDWRPGPIALYAVAIDRALGGGDAETIRRVRDAAVHAVSSLPAGGPRLAVMAARATSASGGGDVRAALEAGLARLNAALGE